MEKHPTKLNKKIDGSLTYSDFEIPVLIALNEIGGSSKPSELYPLIEKNIQKTLFRHPEEYQERKYGQVIWINRIQWARELLKRKRQLDGSIRGIWTITQSGIERLRIYKNTNKDPDEVLEKVSPKYWRMSFKIGSQGFEMWPYCYERGIAAIGCYEDVPLGDLSNSTIKEYNDIWRKKRPENKSLRSSIKNFRYRMKKGDIIYVKNGSYIIGKGIIKSKYEYNPEILVGTKAGEDGEWEHYRKVEWEKNFKKFRLTLGAEPITILNLNMTRLNRIRNMEKLKEIESDATEFEEGQRYDKEIQFRKRNRYLIEIKKINSDYCCEVCDMKFEEIYGDIGKEYIIAHHIHPIGKRSTSSKTTLDEIALLCSNCHDMLHRKDPPLSIQELQRRSEKQRKRVKKHMENNNRDDI